MILQRQPERSPTHPCAHHQTSQALLPPERKKEPRTVALCKQGLQDPDPGPTTLNSAAPECTGELAERIYCGSRHMRKTAPSASFTVCYLSPFNTRMQLEGGNPGMWDHLDSKGSLGPTLAKRMWARGSCGHVAPSAFQVFSNHPASCR